MGISLNGLTPAGTYPGLIKTGDNTAISGTPKVLSDGNGNNLPMEVSTTGVNLTGSPTVNAVAIANTTQVAAKQDTLVSGTNIKTINGTSLLGSGNIPVVTSPSGVSGAIQFSNGSAFASDASNLFWDDTNNRLGIGTNTPTATEHIVGSSNTATDYAVKVLNLRGQGILSVANDGVTQFGDFSGQGYAAAFAFIRPSGSTRATTFSQGNQNLSITNVNGNVTFQNTPVQVVGSGSTSATTSLLVQNSAGASSLQVTDDGSVFNYGKGALTTNTAFGVSAIGGNNTAGNLSAFGRGALQANTSGSSNSAFGRNALSGNSSGSSNSAFGVGCLTANTSGSNNSSLGVDTSSGNFSGSVILGNEATATANNQFVVGSSTTNAGAVNSTTDVPATFLWSVRINGTNYKILMTT